MQEKETRFVALFDLHFGWDWTFIRGQRVKKPTHNLKAVAATLDFISDFKPHVFILGGDQLNFGPISHWNKGKPRLIEDIRIKDEMDLLETTILRHLNSLLPKTGRKIWHVGNHEAWLNAWLDENPGVEGLVEPENYLHLAKRNYELYSRGEISRIGKLHFIHGDTIKTASAKRLVETYRRNIRAGHWHTWEADTDISPIDLHDFHTGVLVPAMSSRAPAYQKNRPDNFMNGFLCGSVWPDGNFNDQVVIINRNRFTVAGKRYGGR